MESTKRILYMAISAVISINLYAQIPEPPKSVLSPNAASLGLYGEIPVSHYTGVPDISIPLYEENIHNFMLPVSLSYHASGVRPDQRPGWVGLNWTLFAGGAITRQVRNAPDELNNPLRWDKFEDHEGYYFKYDRLNDNSWNSKTFLTYTATNDMLVVSDLEPDIFSFSFPGYSGQFYLDHQRNWVVRCNKPVKVEFDGIFLETPFNRKKTIIYNIGNFPCFKGFTITTENGTKFIFGGVTEAIDFSIGFMRQYEDEWEATAWHLTKIILPNGQEISFSYERGGFNCQLYYALQHELGYSAEGSGGLFNPVGPCSGSTYSSFVSGYSGHLIAPVYLSQINTGRSLLEFHRSKSNELNYGQAEIFDHMYNVWGGTTKEAPYDPDNDAGKAFLPYLLIYRNPPGASDGGKDEDEIPEYLRAYWDSKERRPYPECLNELKWDKLDSITVTDAFTGRKEKSVTFSYNNIPTRRLMLENVKETGQSPYRFYYDNADRLPPYLSCKTDHWGFFNDTYAGVPVPNASWSIFDDPGNFIRNYENYYSSREPKSSVSKYGTLNKIVYPTGGYAAFEYEPHSYRKQVKGDRWNGFETLSGNKYAGGLRIKKIIKSGLGGTPDQQLEYYYVTDYLANKTSSQVSSGILESQIKYLFLDYNVSTYDGTMELKKNTFSTVSLLPSGNNLGGSHIGYSQVIEKRGDNSFSLYKYSNYDTGNWDEKAEASLQELYTPYDPCSMKSQERGNLTDVEGYDSNGNIVSKKNIVYEKDAVSGNYVRALNVSSPYICGNDNNTQRRYIKGYSYKIYTYLMRPVKETQTLYYPASGNISSATEKQFAYNNNKLLKAETLTVSENGVTKKYTTETLFTSDIGNITTYNNMKDRLMLNYPVEIVTKVDNTVIKANLITYENLLPKDVYTLKLSTPLSASSFSAFNGSSVNSNYGSPDLSFTRYDASWNPVEVKDKGEQYTTYLWSYNRHLRIADIVNRTYDQVNTGLSNQGKTIDGLSVSGDPGVNFSMLRQVLPEAQIVSYTYERPLVGVSSITSPAGLTTSYLYDTSGRLVEARDQNNVKIGEYRYWYKNQPFTSDINADITLQSVYLANLTTRFDVVVNDNTTGLIIDWYLMDDRDNIISSKVNTAEKYFTANLGNKGERTLVCVVRNADFTKGRTIEKTFEAIAPQITVKSGTLAKYNQYHSDGSPIYDVIYPVIFETNINNSSGDFRYSWYLRNSQGTVISSSLNTAQNEYTLDKFFEKMSVVCTVKNTRTNEEVSIAAYTFHAQAVIEFSDGGGKDESVRGILNLPCDMDIDFVFTYTTDDMPDLILESSPLDYSVMWHRSEIDYGTLKEIHEVGIRATIGAGAQSLGIYMPMGQQGSASLMITDTDNPCFIVGENNRIEIYSNGY
jgi:YD repeat-containing protein